MVERKVNPIGRRLKENGEPGTGLALDLDDRPVRWRVLLHDIAPLLVTILILFAGLAVWEWASGRIVKQLFVSRPTDIWARFLELAGNGVLARNLWVTLQEAFWGFAIGALIGGVMGLVMGRNQFLAKALLPFVVAFFTMPKLALAPLFIIWFGVGMQMKIVLTATVVYFPVFMSTFAGAREVSNELLSIVRVMGGKRSYIGRNIVLPSAMTWFFVGLKLSVPFALLGAVVGELIASNKGTGFLLRRAAGEFDTAGVFAVLGVLVIVGYGSYELVRFLERRTMRWKEESSLGQGMV